ncbi:helix-turn-helix domain-containing protein [Kitasatospora sp. NPDC057223]|uniref:helix-turn-helix domain-containing protein n=1 Tax=Kitasatospora sp. NPDC057223 TaxID=3346055 RepID=UPI0036268CF9
MGQRARELTPDASPLHRWGYELRQLREGRGLSLRGLAVATLIDHSHLGRFERAERMPDRAQVVRLDSALDACGSLVRAWDHVGGRPGVVASSVAHVAKTSAALALTIPQQAASDAGMSVPCRLQDGSVVWVDLDRRSLLRSGVGLGVAAAMGVGVPAAAAADQSAVAALARRARTASAYGSTPVEHLRRTRRLLIESDNVLGAGRVIPTVLEHISVIQELRREAQGSDRADLMELQIRYGELASWLYQDLGNDQKAQFWLDRALQWSHTAGDGELTSYVMARKAQLATDMGDLDDVVDLAEAAQRLARPRSRLAAVARTYQAYGHALRGEALDSERVLDQVRQTLEVAAADPSRWGSWLNPAYVEVYRAQSLQALKRHDQAADAYAGALRMLPDGYHRDRGVYLARQAVALAGAGSPEQAATVGLHALAVVGDTGSGRIVNELVRLDGSLAAWGGVPEVADFRADFNATLLHQTRSEG